MCSSDLVTDNIINDAVTNGIYCDGSGYIITGNTVKDVASATNGFIYLITGSTDCIVNDNKLLSTASVTNYGIKVVGNQASIRDNYFSNVWAIDWALGSYSPANKHGIDSGLYDFDLHTGATGTYVLGGLPDNAVIIRAWYEVLTDLTGAGSSVAISTSKAANEIVTATAFDDAIFNTGGANQGFYEGIPDIPTLGDWTTKTTEVSTVNLYISGADLTAGKIRVWWEWVVSE